MSKSSVDAVIVGIKLVGDKMLTLSKQGQEIRQDLDQLERLAQDLRRLLDEKAESAADPPGTVFVFGSNLAGRHAAGAALDAVQRYGAVPGQAEGRQGDAYAIPTVDEKIQRLPVARISESVTRFIGYACRHRGTYFRVTKIGCGIAGHQEADIAMMFADAPANCWLPKGWGVTQRTT